jgi:heme exporter protein A
MIAAGGISKRFGYRWALKDVSFEVKSGEIAALLGPNGSGKTTLLRILATLTKPNTGSCRLAGINVQKEGFEARAKLGYLAHSSMLYEDLSAEQNLAFYARLYRVRNPSRKIDRLLELFDLDTRRHEPARSFSRGMQQRISLARVLLHRPRVLLLDEPHSGLDAEAVSILDIQLRALVKQGTTILFATHDMERAQSLANKIFILSNGSLVASTTRNSRPLASLYKSAVTAARRGKQ